MHPEDGFRGPGFAHYRVVSWFPNARGVLFPCGGLTLTYQPKIGARLDVSAAVCSVSDNFCRKTGRRIAQGRLDLDLSGARGRSVWSLLNEGGLDNVWAQLDQVARGEWLAVRGNDRYRLARWHRGQLRVVC